MVGFLKPAEFNILFCPKVERTLLGANVVCQVDGHSVRVEIRVVRRKKKCSLLSNPFNVGGGILDPLFAVWFNALKVSGDVATRSFSPTFPSSCRLVLIASAMFLPGISDSTAYCMKQTVIIAEPTTGRVAVCLLSLGVQDAICKQSD